MRLSAVLCALLALPLLTACVNDGATFELDGTREHTLSLIREQPYVWDQRINLYMVVSRMPTCMRRHSMGPGLATSKIEVWQVPSGAFIIKVGKRMYVTETQTCESFIKLTEEPEGGMGALLGTFREKEGALVFIKEETGDSAAAKE